MKSSGSSQAGRATNNAECPYAQIYSVKPTDPSPLTPPNLSRVEGLTRLMVALYSELSNCGIKLNVAIGEGMNATCGAKHCQVKPIMSTTWLNHAQTNDNQS